MDKLFKLQGEKLPCESVWVDSCGMYSVYDKIDIDIDNTGAAEYIITDIIEEGLIVTILN
tara:strand:+ start:5323 stop:5502 length:180 start_codon:yes stop_codon:yes gene_type:complete